MELRDFFNLHALRQQIEDALHILKQAKIEDKAIADHVLNAEQSLRKAKAVISEQIASSKCDDEVAQQS